MREAVEYALKLLRVKVVFVDEAQHLLLSSGHHKPTAQLDWLKALTNRTEVLHVLIGNFDLYDFCHLNGQAARRMRDFPFARYHLDNQKECEEFAGALRSLLEQVPLTVDIPSLLKDWRWFGEWSMGCVGVLSDWVLETLMPSLYLMTNEKPSSRKRNNAGSSVRQDGKSFRACRCL